MMILMVALLAMGWHHGPSDSHGAHDAQPPATQVQPADSPAARAEEGKEVTK